MDEEFKYYNKKMNNMDKYYNEARDLEFKGDLKKAKIQKEKAQGFARDVGKAIQSRIKKNQKL